MYLDLQNLGDALSPPKRQGGCGVAVLSGKKCVPGWKKAFKGICFLFCSEARFCVRVG